MSPDRRSRQLIDELWGKLFYVATGALVLSITFRQSLVGEDPTALEMLKIGWIALTASVILYLFFVGARAVFWERVETGKTDSNSNRDIAYRIALGFVFLMSGSFAAGLVAILGFALANI